MNKGLKILLSIGVFIFLINIINTFIYRFPIDFPSGFLQFVLILFSIISPFLIGVILILNFYKKKGLINRLISLFGLITILLSIPWFFIVIWSSKTADEEKIIFQSLENKNEQILYQYFDEGAIGSHTQEVRIYKFCCGIRYSKVIKETMLNGKWIKFDENQAKDTINFVNYNYNAEH